MQLLVNGFVQDVLQELPMEFAVEAQKLVAISLEGTSDDPAPPSGRMGQMGVETSPNRAHALDTAMAQPLAPATCAAR